MLFAPRSVNQVVSWLIAALFLAANGLAEDRSALTNTVKTYCVQCHGKAAQGGVNLEKMLADPTVGPGFRTWQRVTAALEQ